MAQSNAGQGLDAWIASLDPNGKVPKKASREWSPEDQKNLDFKNAVNDFVDMLTRHGEVNARPDLERSVEENNARRVGGRAVAPAVRGPMQRAIPGVAGTGQPGEGKGPEGGAGDTIKRLIAHLEDRLKGGPSAPKYHSDNPSPETLRQVDQNYQTRSLKEAGTQQRLGGKSGHVNRGLF